MRSNTKVRTERLVQRQPVELDGGCFVTFKLNLKIFTTIYEIGKEHVVENECYDILSNVTIYIAIGV